VDETSQVDIRLLSRNSEETIGAAVHVGESVRDATLCRTLVHHCVVLWSARCSYKMQTRMWQGNYYDNYAITVVVMQ
jgi:steroid 5-alpha reductase family enzyme